MNRSKYVIFMDSDLTNPISDIKKITNKMRLNVDFIKGNRFHSNGELINYQLIEDFLQNTVI